MENDLVMVLTVFEKDGKIKLAEKLLIEVKQSYGKKHKIGKVCPVKQIVILLLNQIKLRSMVVPEHEVSLPAVRHLINLVGGILFVEHGQNKIDQKPIRPGYRANGFGKVDEIDVCKERGMFFRVLVFADVNREVSQEVDFGVRLCKVIMVNYLLMINVIVLEQESPKVCSLT